MLTALRRGDVETDDAGERADEQHDPGRAAQIAPEVGAERGDSDGDGDETHALTEQRPGLVVRGRLSPNCRLGGN